MSRTEEESSQKPSSQYVCDKQPPYPSQTHFDTLSDEHLLQILLYCDYPTLLLVSQTNRRLNNLSKDITIWSAWYKRHFNAKLPKYIIEDSRAFYVRAKTVARLIWQDEDALIDYKKELDIFLLNKQPLPAESLQTLFRYCCKNGFVFFVKELLKIDSVRNNADAANNNALGWAVAGGHLGIVRELLKIETVRNKADMDDNCALRWAAAGGHFEIARELLKIEAVKNDAAAMDNYTLQKALLHGHIDTVRDLLKIEAVKSKVAAK